MFVRLVVAYLVPSGVLLHEIAVAQSEVLPPSFTVTGTVTLTGAEARQSAAELGLEVKDPLSIGARLELAPDHCSLGLQGPRPVTLVDERGQVAATTLPWAAQLIGLGCLPFLFRGEQGGDALEAVLRKAGANFEETALSLEAGHVAYVLGAGEAGTGPTGLVVRKHDLVPLRIWEPSGGARVEVAFGGYRAAVHQGGFPTFLELRAGGALVARFTSSP